MMGHVLLPFDQRFSDAQCEPVDEVNDEQRLTMMLCESREFAKLNDAEWDTALTFLLSKNGNIRDGDGDILPASRLFALVWDGIREQRLTEDGRIRQFIWDNRLDYISHPYGRLRLNTVDGRTVDVWPSRGAFRIVNQGVRKKGFLPWAQRNLI